MADDTANVTLGATIKVKNIENFVANVANDLTANVSGWTGLTSANLEVVGGDLALTAASTIDVTVGQLDGNGTITNAKTLVISDASDTSTITVDTGTATTSVSITGGLDIDIDAGTANGNSTVLTSVTIDGAAGSAAIDSDALTTLSLANLATNDESVTIDNANAAGHDLALTLDNVGKDEDGNDVANVTVDDATADAVNITMVSDSAIDLIADVATEITVAGAGVLTLDASDLDGDGNAAVDANTVTSITVTGAAGIDSDLSGVGSLATFDASGTTGDNTVTLDATVADLVVKGGSGADAITTTGDLGDAEVTLGAGDDTYAFDTAVTGTGTVDAGTGTDTLAADNGANIDAADVYTNFEVLEIGGGQGNYDMDFLSGVTAVKVSSTLANAVNIIDAAAGTTLEFVGDGADDASGNAIDFALKTATGAADSLSVTLTAVDGDDDATADGEFTVASLVADDIETITVTSRVTTLDADDASTPATDESTTAAEYTHVITSLDADALKTLNIKGAASVDITLAAGSVNVNKVDASTATGDVTVDQSASTKAVTFLGGSGDDDVTGTANGDLLVGNAGADAITLGAAGAKDTVRYAADGDSVLELTDANDDGTIDTTGGYDVITGFVSTEDKIELSSALGLATGDARTAITGLGSESAASFTDAAMAASLETLIGDGVGFFNDGAVDRAVATYLFNDTTGVDDVNDALFVFVDANADGDYTAGSDLVVKLTGIESIVISDITFG